MVREQQILGGKAQTPLTSCGQMKQLYKVKGGGLVTDVCASADQL